LKKVHPWAVWGQRTYTSPRNGKTVRLPELSQNYTLIFDRLVPVDSVIQRLAATPSVQTATGPQIGHSTYTPNDWSYEQFQSTGYAASGQWGLSKINAEEAWDLTRGSEDVVVAISEPWMTSSCIDYPHDDLDGKIDNSEVNDCYEDSYAGWHAGAVAGVAGAITDNGNWAASLGWNVQLIGVQWLEAGIMDAIYAGVDVINCSWRISYYDDLNIAVHTALENGIVVVAGNGNGPDVGFSPPVITYPSAFDYSSTQILADTTLTSLGNAQVIAVAASDSVDKYLDYCPGGIPDTCPYNYSPGTSPTTNPSSAFMDVAAPGIRVWILYH
jgi:thermitase